MDGLRHVSFKIGDSLHVASLTSKAGNDKTMSNAALSEYHVLPHFRHERFYFEWEEFGKCQKLNSIVWGSEFCSHDTVKVMSSDGKCR